MPPFETAKISHIMAKHTTLQKLPQWKITRIVATRLQILRLQESHAVAGKPRDTAVNSDRYRVRWHFAGAISVSRMQSVSGCTVYA